MTEHTLVVRFPEDVQPSYSAGTRFQGGELVAVDFRGNRLRVNQKLEEALEALLQELKASGLDGLTAQILTIRLL